MMKMKGALILVAALIVAGGVGYKTGVFKKAESPEQMLAAAFASGEVAQNVTQNITLDLKMKDTVAAPASEYKDMGHLTLVATSKKPEVEGTLPASSITFDGTFKTEETNPMFATINVGGTFMTLGKIFYVKITKMPVLPFFDPEMVKDKWFSIDPVGLTRKFSGEAAAKELEDQLAVVTSKTSEQRAQVIAAYNKNPFMTNPAFHGTEKIAGHTVKNITFTIDKTKFQAFLLDLVATLSKDKNKEITDKDKQDLAEVLGMMSFNDLTIGIGTDDHHVYKMAGTIEVTDTSSEPEMLSMTMLATMDYETPVVIEAPKDSQSIEKLLAPLMMGMMMQGGK